MRRGETRWNSVLSRLEQLNGAGNWVAVPTRTAAAGGGVPLTRTITTTAPLTIDGLGSATLAADRTLAVAAATTTTVGVVELATSGESAAGVVVQGNDARLSDSRTPTAHATSHKLGGTDVVLLHEFGLPTASVAFNDQQATSFRLENRTSDPGSPTEGQIWLRTDL